MARTTRLISALAAGLWLAMAGSVPMAAAGDPEAGAKVFKKCKACHVVESAKNRVGPSLQNLIGRQAGTVENYKYSKAMIAHGAEGTVWNAESLSVYLEAPKKVVPGTKMSFRGLKKAEDRENVIAYLEQFSP